MKDCTLVVTAFMTVRESGAVGVKALYKSRYLADVSLAHYSSILLKGLLEFKIFLPSVRTLKSKITRRCVTCFEHLRAS